MEIITKKSTKPDKKSHLTKKEQLRTIYNKQKLLKSMIKCLGNVTNACKKTGLSRETYYSYLDNDKKFKQQIQDISDIRLDHVESKLDKLIDNDDPKAIMFFLKTKGKTRGYIERTEVDANVRDDRLTGKHFAEAWKTANEKPTQKLKKSKKN